MTSFRRCASRFFERFQLILTATAIVSAAQATAMTPEDCKRLQDMMAKTVPAVAQLRISPTVTDDLWCSVIDGPIGGGWEWQMSQTQESFLLEFRKDRFTYDDIGPFKVTGRVETLDEGSVRIGPVTLREESADRLSFVTDFGALSLAQDIGSKAQGLGGGQLQIAGSAGLIDEVLAWAFRQDLQAAKSSFIAARDQREVMEDWLESKGRPMTDNASAEAFRSIVRAYPNARGQAVLSMREDRPIDVGALVLALLTGSSFSRGDATSLIREAGLRLSWLPD